MVQKVKKKNIGIIYCVSLKAETQFLFVVIWEVGYTSSSDLDYKLSFSESKFQEQLWKLNIQLKENFCWMMWHAAKFLAFSILTVAYIMKNRCIRILADIIDV